MAEERFDQKLNIRTTGLREWPGRNNPYNRYEPTPYKALETLFQNYKLDPQDQVVDFGCGRGRVTFYVHNRFQIPVIGIEANDETYDEALDNKVRYREKARHIDSPVRLKYGLAEHYEIKPADNKFYFFNPFKVNIFKDVLKNIVDSANEHKKTIDIILYYPMCEYKKILEKYKDFQIVNKIRVPKALDPKEKFIIYRMKFD